MNAPAYNHHEVDEAALQLFEQESSKSSTYQSYRLLDHNSEQLQKLCDELNKGIAREVAPTVLEQYAEYDPAVQARWVRAVLLEDPGEHLAALPEKVRETALMFRGLLFHGVLRTALTKRHRVNYGAHPKMRETRRMAVPFTAKDVAAEKTEFAHPDIALTLTVAHYYREGLARGQLREVFHHLNRLATCEAAHLYAGWVRDGGCMSMSLPKRLRNFEEVNLDDAADFDAHLCEAFRRHTAVIEYWLKKVVFPQEAAQYGAKVSATPWDLCRGPELGAQSITVGFSGTDDLKAVCPTSIAQDNLDALAATKGSQIESLRRPENNALHVLKGDYTTREILDVLTSCEQEAGVCIATSGNTSAGFTSVMLDAGALILD